MKISDNIIERAVELWCRALNKPTFDNGDNSLNGLFLETLVTMNIENDKNKVDNIQKRIEIFRNVLSEDIKNKRDNGHYIPWLNVDYHPSSILAKAAEKAGIPESQFSCKSSVYVYEDRVSSSFGYGAAIINHYPLKNGKWLVTDICGHDDMKKILNHVENGNQIGFKVED